MLKKFFVIAVVGVAFFACNKDKEFDTTQEVKIIGSTGIWECDITQPIGTIVAWEGEEPCTRYLINRIWNPAKQRYTGFSHTTEFYRCCRSQIIRYMV